MRKILILGIVLLTQEELRKRREQEEKHAKEQEFLRTSLRGSKKLHALEDDDEPEPPTGFVNDAYDEDGGELSAIMRYDSSLHKSLGELVRMPWLFGVHSSLEDEMDIVRKTLGSAGFV